MDVLNTIQRREVPGGCREIWLAGGCFWGADEYLSRIRGVVSTDVGYANGTTLNPTYEQVCANATGYAETVRVVYDPAVLPLKTLLEAYFKSINPCSVNRQGGDIGDQYRTGIYYTDETDLPAIRRVMEAVAGEYDEQLAVEAKPLKNYWLAEEYHQDYLKKNPKGYCHIPGRLFDYAETVNP